MKEGYFNKEQVEKDFPGMLEEERKRYEVVDSSTASILADKGYTPIIQWCWDEPSVSPTTLSTCWTAPTPRRA